MTDKLLNKSDGKKYRFFRFFIIKNNYLFSTSNSNFEDKLENCYCIKRLGSYVLPQIYLDIKKDNKMIIKNEFIGGYEELMNFIEKNQNNYIVIKGFSRASMGEFLRMLNIKKQINIRPVKFKYKTIVANEKQLIKKK